MLHLLTAGRGDTVSELFPRREDSNLDTRRSYVRFPIQPTSGVVGFSLRLPKYTVIALLVVSIFILCEAYRRSHISWELPNNWLGQMDSNHRSNSCELFLPESKSGALPLGNTPSSRHTAGIFTPKVFPLSYSQYRLRIFY